MQKVRLFCQDGHQTNILALIYRQSGTYNIIQQSHSHLNIITLFEQNPRW